MLLQVSPSYLELDEEKKDKENIIFTKKDLDCGHSIIETFSFEFKRQLTHTELQILSDLVERFGERLVLYALDEAVVDETVSFQYIEKILKKWSYKGLTLTEIERGDR